MRYLAALGLALAICGPAMAHEWFTGTSNPVTGASCCYGGPTGDCQPIDEADWWREGAAYKVRQGGKVYSIPANQALPSQDHQGRAAACIMHGQLRCFFVPMSG